MTFRYCKARVLNRGQKVDDYLPPDSFLTELVEWARTAPDEIFAPTPTIGPSDIYNKVRTELGPWISLAQRKCVMLEVLRVLAGFESSWDWTEGVDTSRLSVDTPENAEAGAWQVSYGSRNSAPNLHNLIDWNHITNGMLFQRAMKFNHPLAMEYVSRLLRNNTKENGPLYKGDERLAIRKSLRGEEQSIYPWLFRKSVEEFQSFL
jgi:hypothetical protein